MRPGLALLPITLVQLLRPCSAWIAAPRERQPQHAPSGQRRRRLEQRQIAPASSSEESAIRLGASSSGSEDPGLPASSSTRRQWLQTLVSATVASAGCLSSPLPASAAELVSAASTCDASVSIWKRADGRLVYLLGTAHISSASAELAGSLVRDIHPSGVFVELDPKRVKGTGILAKRLEGTTDENDSASGTKTSKVIVPNIQQVSTKASSTSRAEVVTSMAAPAAAASTAPPQATPSRSNPMVKAASVAVGNSIKGMYKKLDSAGFQAGEEFVVAIKEGQAQGADIVLGDRDVEVTLRRLTEGLAQTDLKALLNPDSELEQSLKELVPSTTSSGKKVEDGDLNDDEFRQEFSAFVETMKAKENVKKIMGELERVAPALYQALVSERDAYMAAGLNGLDELQTIVAVMGIAHVDGVEKSLAQNGWKPVQPACSIKST